MNTTHTHRNDAKAAGPDRSRIRYAIGQCSLGSILVASSSRGICAILIGDDPKALALDLRNRFRDDEPVRDDTGLAHELAQVAAFVEAPAHGLELSLDLHGTPFQQRVWQALLAIPAGQTASYTEITRRVGEPPQSVRAVAGAIAANSLAVAIPCHRAVHKDGTLAGYRWGIERKRALLEREAGGER